MIGTTRFGRTGLEISRICVGTAAWGLTSPVHGVTVAEDVAIGTARRVFEGPLNLLDTSNNYGGGESERRIGAAIAAHGGLPAGFVLQTKLDNDPVTGSFSADRMRASLEESLDRLGLDRVPVLYLHDPDHLDPADPQGSAFEQAMAPGGPVGALLALRDKGYTDFVGVAGGHAGMLQRFVETGLFDALITHNRYTLVDRSADGLLTAAADAGVGVINAAVYGGGILSRWPREKTMYHYGPAAPELLTAIDAIGAACAAAGVPLAAAALQFSMRDPRVHATLCGMVSPQQIDETLALSEIEIPDDLWAELDALCPPAATWLNPPDHPTGD